jgi:peptidoglycan/xylan/chitin deacetylase (PgdA/CDA1 family)
MYHRVIDATGSIYPAEPGTWVDVRTFGKQMSFIKEKCDIVTLPELVESLYSGAKPLKPICAITFDDGWRDSFTNAFPLLRSLDIPATIFLTTQCIKDGKAPWFSDVWEALLHLTADTYIPLDWPPAFKNELVLLSRVDQPIRRVARATRCIGIIKSLSPELRAKATGHIVNSTGWSSLERSMLSWDEVRTMHKYGVGFGAHTRTHPILTCLSDLELKSEISDAKLDIEDALGCKIVSFAYPNGDWSNRVRDVVACAGYRLACTTTQSHCTAFDDTLTLPRIGIHEGFSMGVGSFSPRVFGLRLGIV